MIVVIGNRFGFLIPLFVLFSELGVESVADSYFGAGFFHNHLWVWAVGLLIAAAVCWLLGRALRGQQPPVTDPKTGGQPVPGTAAYARYAMREIDKEANFNNPPDSFFFLPMYFWGPVLTVIALVVLLVGWLR